MSIIFMAYDSYNDVWPGFIKCKNKYWEDCDYPIIMVNCATEKEQLSENVSSGVDRVICVGKETEWTERLHKALENIESRYILLWLEDLFVDRPLDSMIIKSYVDLMDKHEDIGCIRICNDSGYQRECEWDKTLGELLPGHAYRVSTHPSIWRKEYLYQLTEKYVDAWNFEYQVGYECDKYSYRNFITKKDVLHFTNMVWRAKWTKEAVQLDKKENLEIDYSKRKKHSFWSNFKTDINTLIFKVLGADRVTKIVMKRRANGKGIPKA